MDATIINKKVRAYLDELGIENDDLYINLPLFDEGYWYVSITDLEHERLFGIVVLSPDGIVLTHQSYPN